MGFHLLQIEPLALLRPQYNQLSVKIEERISISRVGWLVTTVSVKEHVKCLSHSVFLLPSFLLCWGH